VLGYQTYRLAHRAVSGSSKPAKPLICTILPAGVFAGNSLAISTLNAQRQIGIRELLYCCGALNSFVLDSALPPHVTTNINMHFVYQVPVPRIASSDPAFAPIVARAARLICTSPAFADLWNEVMKDAAIFAAAQATVRSERTPGRSRLDARVRGNSNGPPCPLPRRARRPHRPPVRPN